MRKNLNINNSKKLVLGVSILFCTVILIIGVTTAFFTQSDTKETDNIVSTDINRSLGYSDNNDYMLGNLIPINIDDVDKAYTREGNLKCKDDNGYNVCSIYSFTITNNADVSQSLIIDLYPVVNSFHNLRFNLYDITNSELLISNKELKYDDKNNISLDSLLLDASNKKSNEYELVFYIENQNYAQDDVGKNFGATIKVNSITTGYNLVRDLGTICWKADENDNTILSEFTGYKDNNENGGFDETDELKKECEMYFKKDTDNYYIVNVPSTYGGYIFESLGNNLFNAVNEYYIDEETEEEIIKYNEYSKIKNIIIGEGIEEMEDVIVEATEPSGTFFYVGSAIENNDIKLNIQLPNSLTKIGSGSFLNSNLKLINIPSNVKIIGDSTFAFTKLSEITIPKSVEEIGGGAFIYTPLTKVNFEVDENGSSDLKVIGGGSFMVTELTGVKIPYSVNYIGEQAFFGIESLMSLTFLGDLEDITNELIIGQSAFANTILNYTVKNDPLIIPARVKKIEPDAFIGTNEIVNLNYIKYMGDRESFDNLGDNWYNSTYVKYIKPKDEYVVE